MLKKDLTINGIRVVEVEDSKNIPTVLHYQGSGKVLIGAAACRATSFRGELIEDFKVDLGNIEAATGKSLGNKREFTTPSGDRKSALGVASDFFREVLKSVNTWLDFHDIREGTSVLLAEPLSIHNKPEWLANYRKNITRILDRRMSGADFDHINLERIDFLPEPFAVFQHYRYGYRHPLLMQRTKQNALVIDFGGGTFDVCIIETTKEGDISQTGKNSKPLAASSAAAGGYTFNRAIVEHLYRGAIARSNSGKLNKAMDLYRDWRKGKQDLHTTSDEYRNFIHNFHAASYAIEETKIALCKSISNWDLDAQSSLAAPVNLPRDPFASQGGTGNFRLSANELREIFVSKIWTLRLRDVVHQALVRGKEELRGAPISVVLLSGGSANIGWLARLLERDFASEFEEAEILHLPDFQDVVASGLAIECARRFYDEEGDFSSVTYNRLCLILDVGGAGPEIRAFKPRTQGLPTVSGIPGVLLPSASVLRQFIDKPIRWRVHTERSPKHVGYYFLKSSFDPEDTANRLNVEDTTVIAPPGTSFDANLQIELTVRQDSTAIPRFVYKTGRTELETVAKAGKPFYLDMTYGQTASPSKAYIGFDFGTSNSSVSFVDARSIEVFRRRSTESSWLELSDLSAALPYPLAAPLAWYLSQSESDALTKGARVFIEASLAMGAYISYLEYCTKKGRKSTSLFKGFNQRSAGPLWRFLRDCLGQLRSDAEISAPLKELLSGDIFEIVDKAVTFISQEKHDKAGTDQIDLVRPVHILGNISQKIFRESHFGYFENVRRKRYTSPAQFEGLFRIASGVPPFIRTLMYAGTEAFPEQVPFIVSPEKGYALPLDPLIFWDSCKQHFDGDGHCYVYDIPVRTAADTYSFKAVGYNCFCHVDMTSQHSAIAERLSQLRCEDPKTEVHLVGSLTLREE